MKYKPTAKELAALPDNQIGKHVYVLHAFKKKSPSGIKTAKKDLDLIHRRYKEAQELAKNGKEERRYRI